jgi:hypothetical protein
MRVLAYKLFQMISRFYIWDEKVKRSIDCLIKRLISRGSSLLRESLSADPITL